MDGFRFLLRGSRACLRYGRLYPHLESAEEEKCAQKERGHWNEIGCQSIWRLIQHLRAVMLNKILFDFCFTFPLCQHFTDQLTPLTACFRGTYIQRRALTDRAIELLSDAVYVIIRGSGTLSVN